MERYADPASTFGAGPGRCECLFEHVAQWVEKYAYSLFVADMQADSWGAVLIQNRFVAEFTELSNRLGVSWLVGK